jgi:hypothetical protein
MFSYDQSSCRGDTMDAAEFEARYGTLLLRSWTNEDFLAELLAHPAAALRAVGLDTPPGTRVEIVRQTSGEPDISKQFDMWEEGLQTQFVRLVVPEVPQISADESDGVLNSFHGLMNESSSGCATTSCYSVPNPHSSSSHGGNSYHLCTTCTPCCSTG